MRKCGSCGKDPTLECVSVDPAPHVRVATRKGSAEPAIRGEKNGVRRKHRKSSHFVIVVSVCLIFSALLLSVGMYFWKGTVESPVSAGMAEKEQPGVSGEKSVLKDQMPEVHQSFVAYLIAATNEDRAQFVWDPIRVVPRIDRFSELNSFVRIDPQGIALASAHLLELPEGQAIEAAWTSRGRVYDTVFMRKDGEWRLDWEHFVRFSDYPLPLFLAGEGPDEGEFRLYVRERLARERSDEPDMSLVFYTAMAGKTSEAGFQSPEFLVQRESVAGRRLAAAFREAGEGMRPFGSRLKVEDPNVLVHVRVKIRREEAGGVRRFEVVDLPACHWYGVTDSVGVAEGKEDE